MLKFAANLSMLFTERPLSERFQAAKRQGFKAVEIQFPYELDAGLLKSLLEQQQLQMALFNVAADDLLRGGEGLACVPEKQSRFKHALDQALAYAEVLQPAAVNVLPGRCLDARRQPGYLAVFKENLVHAADQFARLGIKTVFEAINHHDMPGFLIADNRQALAVWSELSHPNLYLQYDIYHSLRMGEDPVSIIAEQSDKIAHIQFADCPGRGQPGSGSVDFAGIFSAIETSAYSGWLGAEYKPSGGTEASLDWFDAYR